MRTKPTRSPKINAGRTVPPTWRSCLPYAFVSTLYLFLAFSLRFARGGGVDWNDFLALMDVILQGKGLHLQQYLQNYFTFSFPPFPYFLMALFRFLGQWWGLSQGAQDVLIGLPMLAADLFSAWMLVRIVRRFRATTPRQDLFLFTLYLTAWVVFFDSAYHSHFESLLLGLLILSIDNLQEGRFTRSGIILGLAFLVKQTAVVPAIPLFLALFHRAGPKTTGKVLAAAAATALVFYAPFLFSDFGGVERIFLQGPNQRPIGYQTTWWIFAGNDGFLEWLAGAGSYLNAFMLLLMAGYSALMVRRYGVGYQEPRFLGLCAACSVIMVFLEGWGSLHYFLMPFGFLLAWEAATDGWPWISILFTAVLSDQFILKYSSETHFGFNPWTAWAMILLFSGTLVYVTDRLKPATQKVN